MKTISLSDISMIEKRIALLGRGKRVSTRASVGTIEAIAGTSSLVSAEPTSHIHKHELRALQELASDLPDQDDAAITAGLKVDVLLKTGGRRLRRSSIHPPKRARYVTGSSLQ